MKILPQAPAAKFGWAASLSISSRGRCMTSDFIDAGWMEDLVSALPFCFVMVKELGDGQVSNQQVSVLCCWTVERRMRYTMSMKDNKFPETKSRFWKQEEVRYEIVKMQA